MKQTAKGEMTVFLSLTLMLIASLLFTLVEGARYRCLRSLADMDRIMETESAFAEFDTSLLKNYGLLFLDASYGSGEENLNRIAGRIMSLAEYNLNPDTGIGSDFLRMKMLEASVDHYELATDYGGDAFRRQVVEYTKENLGSMALDLALEKIEKGTEEKPGAAKTQDTTGYDPAGKVSSGKQAAKEAREAEQAAKEAGEELSENGITPATDFENPLELFETLFSSSLMVLVLPKGKTLSTKETDLSDSLMKRSLNTGNYPEHKATGLTDQALFLAYLDREFGCFTNVKDKKKLDYELEYILCGHDSDAKNVADVTARILLIREVTNYLYLQTDGEKQAIAESIAVAIGAVTMNPAVVVVVKQAILAAWAYVESLMEMRTLLSGGRVAIVKTAADWKTDVLHPATSFRKGEGVDDKGIGFSYEDYLLQFLLLMGAEKQNMRTMDMMEQNIRLLTGNPHFRMDCMIQRMDVSYSYQARPLFLSFVTIGDIDRGNYRFDQEYSISYLTGDKTST